MVLPLQCEASYALTLVGGYGQARPNRLGCLLTTLLASTYSKTALFRIRIRDEKVVGSNPITPICRKFQLLQHLSKNAEY